MVPALTKNGRSFKGAALYYLHDKRQEGEAETLTAGRVAWTSTVNLATDDPDRAWRMMAHTALAQADLKSAAGIKATGRKLASPVLAYSLAWHPDERPTQAEQLEAAHETLKELGVDGHQAIIVAHNDEPHAHVHVVVNRVNPETGVAATLSNSKLVLSKWAERYEQQRGKIYCPERVKNNERRKQREKVTQPRKSRTAYEFEKAANDSLAAEFVRSEQKQKDAQLYATHRQIEASHARQWTELKRTYGVVRDRMTETTVKFKERKTAEIQEQAKSEWRELFRTQKAERNEFDARERGIISWIGNFASLYRSAREEGRDGRPSMLFLSLLSSTHRRAMFNAGQEGERRTLARRIRTEIKAAHRTIDREADRDFVKIRDAYAKQRAQLKATQNGQQADMRAAKNTRNAERRQALAPYRSRAARWEDFNKSREAAQKQRQDRGRQRDRGMRPGME